MKVAKLIAELQKFDPDLDVRLVERNNNVFINSDVQEIILRKNKLDDPAIYLYGVD